MELRGSRRPEAGEVKIAVGSSPIIETIGPTPNVYGPFGYTRSAVPPCVSVGRACGEASTSYSRWPRIIPRSIKDRVKHGAAMLVDMDRIIRPMSPARIAALKAHFRPFNHRLAAYTGRDLSHWA